MRLADKAKLAAMAAADGLLVGGILGILPVVVLNLPPAAWVITSVIFAAVGAVMGWLRAEQLARSRRNRRQRRWKS